MSSCIFQKPALPFWAKASIAAMAAGRASGVERQRKVAPNDAQAPRELLLELLERGQARACRMGTGSRGRSGSSPALWLGLGSGCPCHARRRGRELERVCPCAVLDLVAVHLAGLRAVPTSPRPSPIPRRQRLETSRSAARPRGVRPLTKKVGVPRLRRLPRDRRSASIALLCVSCQRRFDPHWVELELGRER